MSTETLPLPRRSSSPGSPLSTVWGLWLPPSSGISSRRAWTWSTCWVSCPTISPSGRTLVLKTGVSETDFSGTKNCNPVLREGDGNWKRNRNGKSHFRLTGTGIIFEKIHSRFYLNASVRYNMVHINTFKSKHLSCSKRIENNDSISRPNSRLKLPFPGIGTENKKWEGNGDEKFHSQL